MVNILLVDRKLIEAYNSENKGYSYCVVIRHIPMEVLISKTSNNKNHVHANFRELTLCLKEGAGDTNGKFCSIAQRKSCLFSFVNTFQDKSQFGYVIQCERDHKKDSTKLKFGIREKYYLRIYSILISKTIQGLIIEYYAKRSLSRSMGIMQYFQDITHEKSIARIFLAVRDFLPKVFNCRKVGFFVIDQKNSKYMFTVTSIGKDEDTGATCVESISTYPISFGYTGKCILQKKVLQYYSKKEEVNLGVKSSLSDADFAPELDNQFGLSNLHNAIFGPLIDGDGNTQGAIQVINKDNGKEHFDDEDIKEFKIICGVIGTIVRNAKQSFNVTLTPKFTEMPNRMAECVNSVDELLLNKDFDYYQGPSLDSKIENIQRLVTKMVKEKRIAVFENPHYMNQLFESLRKSKETKK